MLREGFFLFLEVNECAKYYFYRLGNFKLRWACLGNFGQLYHPIRLFITSPSKINVKTPLLPKVFAKYNNFQKTKCILCNNKKLDRDSPPLSSNVSRASVLKFKERRISQYLTLVFNNLKLSLQRVYTLLHVYYLLFLPVTS